MKHDEPFDHWLTRALKEEKPYLADEGFTQNVMVELPRPSALQRKIRILLAVPVVAIGLLVLWQLPLQRFINTLWRLLLEFDLGQLFLFGAMISTSFLLGACAWLARQMRLI